MQNRAYVNEAYLIEYGMFKKKKKKNPQDRSTHTIWQLKITVL